MNIAMTNEPKFKQTFDRCSSGHLAHGLTEKAKNNPKVPKESHAETAESEQQLNGERK